MAVCTSKFILKNILIVLLLIVAGNLEAQTLIVDSTQVVIPTKDSVEFHSPQRAALLSAILPGLGQVYNKKVWKVPLIYAGIGTIGYFIGWNNKNYKIYRTAYNDISDGDETTNSFLDIEASKYYDLDNPTQYNNFKTGLSRQQDYLRRNRDLLIISMAAFYGLNIIDASVDAHFFDFDISEDLTFNWQPTMGTFNKQPLYGFNCTFNF